MRLARSNTKTKDLKRLQQPCSSVHQTQREERVSVGSLANGPGVGQMDTTCSRLMTMDERGATRYGLVAGNG